jgi:Prp8 binding protein
MRLTGHEDEVFALRFNPAGDVLATGSHDKTAFLWRTYGECENFLVLRGHRNAVLELHWTPDGEGLATCSPDRSVRLWDALTGECVASMAEHGDIVNTCAVLRRGTTLIASGSDDRTLRIWDPRAERAARRLEERAPVLATCFSDGGDLLFAAGVEGAVRAWDLRRDAASFEMEGHTEMVTGMALAPDGAHLLTNSADNTLRRWDVRPYAPADRCAAVYTGHRHGLERNLLRCGWSPDGKRVTAGSADRFVYVWDAAGGGVEYALPGHAGSVNDATFHPSEPIVASASSDKTVYMGELAE